MCWKVLEKQVSNLKFCWFLARWCNKIWMIHLWVDNFWLGQDTLKICNVILKWCPAISKGTSSKSKDHNNPVLLWINRFHFNECNQILFNYYFKLFQLNFWFTNSSMTFTSCFLHIHSFTMISQASSPDGFFFEAWPPGAWLQQQARPQPRLPKWKVPSWSSLGSSDQLGPSLFSRWSTMMVK